MHPLLIAGIVAAGVLLLFFLVYLFLLAPSVSAKRRARMKPFTQVKYAHRGLHDGTRAENSLSAFRAAVEAGYGIELDVRLSKDGELMVFHDDTLERVASGTGRVDAYTAAELGRMQLSGTEDTVPTFRQVIELVDGRVPLLVEIKEDAGKYGVTEKCAEMLREYKGEYIVESFNPLALGRFKKLMPEVCRGVLAETFTKNKKYRKPMYVLLQCLVLNVVCRPDFIAFNHRDARNAALGLARGLFRAPAIAWTTRSEDEEAAAIKHGFRTVIFENYLSENKASQSEG